MKTEMNVLLSKLPPHSKTPLAIGDIYYTPSLTWGFDSTSLVWENDSTDNTLLAAGRVFINKEEAEKVSKIFKEIMQLNLHQSINL